MAVKCSSRSRRGWEASADLSWCGGLSLPLRSPGPVHTSPENHGREDHTCKDRGAAWEGKQGLEGDVTGERG